ncbi:hypothetical protein FJY71_08680, partial [candidate division WOR-3 bacterium]|nr:hypothetical protein [candidate division WOR-3 bacterium]
MSYASPVFGRATGWLVKPAAGGRCPVVVYGHWGLGTATEFLPEALLYAEAGVGSLHVTAPWARPRPFYRAYKGYRDGEGDRNAVIQAVVDVRRG